MGMMTRHNKKARAVRKAVLAKRKPVEVKKQVEEKKDAFYTKTDITTMKVADLRSLAKEQGIEDADNISGAELKNILIEKMGL